MKLSSPALVLSDQRFSLQNEIQIRLHEKIFTLTETFNITDNHNNQLFQIRHKILSIRDKRALLDNTGHEVLFLQHKLLNFGFNPTKFVILDASGNPVARVRRKAFSLFNRERLSIEFINKNTNENVKITVTGDLRKRNASIYLHDKNGKHHVAQISEKFFNIEHLVFHKDQYILRCAAGVDISLMVMICIALDEDTRK